MFQLGIDIKLKISTNNNYLNKMIYYFFKLKFVFNYYKYITKKRKI